MKVTVCEFQDDPAGLAQDWERLVTHVQAEASDLVLLPELPFYPWPARVPDFDPAVWQDFITVHDAWQERLDELAPAVVLSTRPVNLGDRRLNEGFIWDASAGYHAAHHKYYLPDDDGFWEASWYQRGEGDFTPVEGAGARIGFMICTELWFLQQARRYGQTGAHLIVTPRATGRATLDKWLVGGRAAAVVSGAFSLSSNRVNSPGQSPEFGGQGWVIGPDGDILAVTSGERPFVSVEIDLSAAERAKKTYPRNVLE
jgi:N-carbamoylputrescine amidase